LKQSLFLEKAYPQPIPAPIDLMKVLLLNKKLAAIPPVHP